MRKIPVTDATGIRSQARPPFSAETKNEWKYSLLPLRALRQAWQHCTFKWRSIVRVQIYLRDGIILSEVVTVVSIEMRCLSRIRVIAEVCYPLHKVTFTMLLQSCNSACKMWRSQNAAAAEDSSLLGCDTLSLGEWLLMFWRYDKSSKHHKPHTQQHCHTPEDLNLYYNCTLCDNAVKVKVIFPWNYVLHNYCCWPRVTIEWVAWLFCVWEVPGSFFGFQVKTSNRMGSLTSTCFTVHYSLIILQFCTIQFTPVNHRLD